MDNKREVKSRQSPFAKKITTKIWQEIPSAANPYLAETCLCHGYNILELMEKRSFLDVLYLLFRGELPNADQAELLEQFMIAMLNPGPRHPATRASMVAGVAKTDLSHILPIGLAISGGQHQGGGCLEETVRFFRKNLKKDPIEVSQQLLESSEPPVEGDWQPVPGFGSHFGEVDVYWQSIAEKLIQLPGAGKSLHWGSSIAESLSVHNIGWLSTGITAAVLSDLGFHPKACGGLFQLFSAPGLLAHGVEMCNKPITAMPFPADEDYTIEE